MTNFPKPECITVQDGYLQGSALWPGPSWGALLSAFLLVSLGVHQYSLVLIKIDAEWESAWLFRLLWPCIYLMKMAFYVIIFIILTGWRLKRLCLSPLSRYHILNKSHSLKMQLWIRLCLSYKESELVICGIHKNIAGCLLDACTQMLYVHRWLTFYSYSSMKQCALIVLPGINVMSYD